MQISYYKLHFGGKIRIINSKDELGGKLDLLSVDSTGKPQVNTRGVFCNAVSKFESIENILFDDFLSMCDENVKEYAEKNKIQLVTSQALGNSRGRWYEWLINLGFLIWCNKNSDARFFLLQLPSISSFDSSKIFSNRIYSKIETFRSTLKAQKVTLTTSNPDFIVISNKNVSPPKFHNNPGGINEKLLLDLSESYNSYVGACELNDVVGYLAVKSSMRPDRRLQIAHEGSIYKALSKHISVVMDQEIYIPKFWAVSSKVNEQDVNALKTVATHSIAEVNSTPMRAVDELVVVNSQSQLEDFLSKIQNSLN